MKEKVEQIHVSLSVLLEFSRYVGESSTYAVTRPFCDVSECPNRDNGSDSDIFFLFFSIFSSHSNLFSAANEISHLRELINLSEYFNSITNKQTNKQ
jgi:hypothetical protein